MKKSEIRQPNLVGRDYKEWKEYSEAASGDDNAGAEALGQHRQGEPEAKEVRPVCLDVCQPLVELQALVEPLVLEAVE